jgi:predicted kinase
VAHEVLASGGAVLDFGYWSTEEGYAIRVIAERAGAQFALEDARVDEDERRRCATRRWRDAPHTTFEMTDA